MSQLKKLFSPIQIGSMELKNRIVMAPMNSCLGNDDGTVTPALISYYEARAKGGTGLIVLPSISVDKISPFKGNLVLWDDKFIDSFKKIAEAVHPYGTKMIPQLCHPAIGFNITSMDKKDIKRMVIQFGEAAARAIEGGCDGIQLHAAHARMLLGTFISSTTNHRIDEYGGSIESRFKLLFEVIEHVKEKIGTGFPVIVRMSGDEMTHGGRTIRETQYIAPLLVDAGVDILDISMGVYGQPLMGGAGGTGSPEGLCVKYTKAIKEIVDIPVVTVGRINNPEYAEYILRRNEADLIALGRALIADPEWTNKAAEGRYEDIAPCIGCLLGCSRRDGGITCLINPRIGKERESVITKTDKPKNVMIIGAGPAGLEASRVSALRGHNVTLYEKEPLSGGQLQLASIPPMKQEITKILKYLNSQAEKAGVKMHMNTLVTPEMIKEAKPDVVIVSTGAEPKIPEFCRKYEDEIVTAFDVLSGKKVFGSGKLAIIGGGMVGCEVADMIRSPGYGRPGTLISAVIIEMLNDICLDISGDVRASLLERLKEKDVHVFVNTKVTGLSKNENKFIINTEKNSIENIDTLVIASGAVSVDEISIDAKTYINEVYVIGDASEPRRAMEAIAEGYETGYKL